MNMLVRDMFGEYYVRIPLRASPSIVCANSLRTDWESVVPKNELSYILGNPPFVGSSYMSVQQKEDMSFIYGDLKNTGVLDFVTAWYKKATGFIQGTNIEVAFVSTNSICQGEAVAPLWNVLFNVYGIKINFAHQTFRWNNEARGKAAVFCVIIGFGLFDRQEKKLFHYVDVDSDPVESVVKQINAYLVDGPNVIVESRSSPICTVPAMVYGNKPVDGGFLILSENEKNDLLQKEPDAEKYIRKLLGAEEYINNINRYCLWLVDINPSELKKLPLVIARIEAVKTFRLASAKEATRKWSAYSTRFIEIRQPDSDYIIVPCTSSERRKYIPIGFFNKETIVNNLVQIIPDGTMYDFGILTSTMHMAWMRYVCGRLKSDYRYSKDIVYNNFPWPTPNEKQEEDIEKAAQDVLDARKMYPNSSLADLYDPDLMPAALVKAHTKLDRLVEKAYGKTFTDDSERVSFLFEEYRKLSEGLFVMDKKRKDRIK